MNSLEAATQIRRWSRSTGSRARQCIDEIGLGLQQPRLQFAQQLGCVCISRSSLCNFEISLDAVDLKLGFLIIDSLTHDFQKPSM